MAFYGFFNRKSDWSGGAEDTATTAARDTAYQDQSVVFANNEPGAIGWTTPLTDCWIHFNLYASSAWNGNASTDGTWFHIIDANGHAVARCQLNNGNSRHALSASGTSFTSASDGVLPGATLTAVDIHIEIDNVDGDDTYTVYHDGIEMLNITLAHNGNAGIVSMSFNNYDTNTNLYYSEVMVADEDTRGLRVATLTPDGNSATNTGWTGAYTDVDSRGDGLSVYTETAGQRDGYTLSAYGGPASPTAIRGVFMQTYAAKGATGPQNLDLSLTISATNYDLGPMTITQGQPIIGEWASDPATLAPWLTTAFASLEIGVEAVA